MKKRGLGKGLSELGVEELLTSTLTPTLDAAPETNLAELPLSALQPGRYQPRRVMDKEALSELADSIRSQGVIQPIVVRPVESGGYEIIAGERRWRAAQLAELESVPVVIKHIGDEAALAMSLIENIQRQDLNVIEESEALQRLLDEFNMTHQQVAQAVGKSRTSVTNLLRLLKLTPKVRALLEQGSLDMGHGRALLAIPCEQQLEFANTIVERSLSVREAERMIRKLQEPQKTPDKQSNLANSEVEQLQKNLTAKLNAKVAIKQKKTGSGKLVIQYKNLEQLDAILNRIQ